MGWRQGTTQRFRDGPLMTESMPESLQAPESHTSASTRWRLFAGALLLVVLSATGLCMLVAMKTVISLDLFTLWGSIVAGPFSALWTFPENPNVTFSLINLTLLFAHPIWPNRFTATLTCLAFASWLFWGMAVSLSGV
jgi:hypothetical protein